MPSELFFPLYHREKKLYFDEIMISIMSPFHSDIVYHSLYSYSLMLLVYPGNIVFGLIRPKIEPTIYRTQSDHANHHATNVVYKNILIEYLCK